MTKGQEAILKALTETNKKLGRLADTMDELLVYIAEQEKGEDDVKKN